MVKGLCSLSWIGTCCNIRAMFAGRPTPTRRMWEYQVERRQRNVRVDESEESHLQWCKWMAVSDAMGAKAILSGQVRGKTGAKAQGGLFGNPAFSNPAILGNPGLHTQKFDNFIQLINIRLCNARPGGASTGVMEILVHCTYAAR
ncbi:hypothetical protein LX32DRAFT_658963 [Colletotrichum zoysiae]|uniref:Uncharacterized protein n=1 Tax=Colletotrichum zoysiae TaxID=1216348 RepID=A0AAD9H341_9PEZI|nr:hypothetical protein LX32DRAFT_658963 [Colletotrichum zoysiae]